MIIQCLAIYKHIMKKCKHGFSKVRSKDFIHQPFKVDGVLLIPMAITKNSVSLICAKDSFGCIFKSHPNLMVS